MVFLCTNVVQGQETSVQDSTAVIESDPLPLKFDSTKTEEKVYYPFLSAISPYIDYGKLLTLPFNFENKLEFGIQVEFKNKIMVNAEFGSSELYPQQTYSNAQYSVTGDYFRVGLGYKIPMKNKYNFGISARYAQSFFSDQGTVKITSASGLYENLEEPFKRSDLTARWYELVLNSEVNAFSNFYLGFFFRLRFMDKYDKQNPLDVAAVPGFGRTFNTSVPAINLYIRYAFQFKSN